MTNKGIVVILILVAVAVLMAGCTTPAQKIQNILYGKDVFNPDKFSMATYVVGSDPQNATGELIVLAYPGQQAGDRLSSILVNGNNSSRMDVWLDSTHESINNDYITVINPSGLQVETPSATLNMTTMDQTWNSPGSEYALNGNQSVTVPAGTYSNCSVYFGDKTIVYSNMSINVSVLYYMSPNSPVPVLYEVQVPGGNVYYALKSEYGPNDVDSTPERTIQSYFDRLGAGQYSSAAELLLEAQGSALVPMDPEEIAGMASNMTNTYGVNGETTGIQYVMTDSVSPISDIGGFNAVIASWHSIQYERSAGGQVYSINGTFNMVDEGGEWKIVV
jgi:hypothetical protein